VPFFRSFELISRITSLIIVYQPNKHRVCNLRGLPFLSYISYSVLGGAVWLVESFSILSENHLERHQTCYKPNVSAKKRFSRKCTLSVSTHTRVSDREERHKQNKPAKKPHDGCTTHSRPRLGVPRNELPCNYTWPCSPWPGGLVIWLGPRDQAGCVWAKHAVRHEHGLF